MNAPTTGVMGDKVLRDIIPELVTQAADDTVTHDHDRIIKMGVDQKVRIRGPNFNPLSTSL